MNRKKPNAIAIAVATALISSMNAHSSTIKLNTNATTPKQIKPLIRNKKIDNQKKNNISVFTPEENLGNIKSRYIVRLTESPAALYSGGIPGFKATQLSPNTLNRKLNVNNIDVRKYRNYLNNRHIDVTNKARSLLGQLDIKQTNTLAFNGFVVEMTQSDAIKLATVSGIAHIKREVLRKITTDAGPDIIKAPNIWDGTATGTASKGEGMVVGIIDTGINTDHPSFADIGADGYDHINPNGEGVYSGDCESEEWKSLCNDKLIGVHSYPEITDLYADYNPDVPKIGEDHNGHGSHTAGTAAGNILKDIALVDVNGKDSGVSFSTMAGVAPHANIVSYQVCLPGESDSIGFAGCFPSLTIKAVEHAIENGVDALNYSIGGGSSDPWNDADSLSFLAARKAGIHVATSAGNSGPEPETVGSPGDAPWITTAAAYTHDRGFSDKEINSFTGGNSTPSNITGSAITEGITGKVVYAGDFVNSNDPDGDPEQCLQPFPESTFAENTIVVCDRGAIARVDKGKHVLAGGAAGLILANLQDGASSVVADMHVIPAIHVNADNGDIIKSWLSSGENHMATITATEIIKDDSIARIAAGFTSRGPNKSVPDIISPSIAGPGVEIFAAYANEQPEGFKANPDPMDYAFLSGTSMSSPHIAGALTLLSSLKPSWSPAEAQSALMLTANQNTFKEDGETVSDFFDMGSGYADVSSAAQSGIVLDETYANYMGANPTVGGQPSNINLPSMANSQCVLTCSWKRTIKAVKDGSWSASTQSISSEGFVLTVEPSSFSLTSGDTQEITVTANVENVNDGWNFGNVILKADGLPEAKMPIAAKYSGDNIPNGLSITAHRNKDQMQYTGMVSSSLTNIKAAIYDKKSNVFEPQTLSVPFDSFAYFSFSTSEVIPNINFTTQSEALDVDLRILDGAFNRIGRSAGPDSNESVSFTNLPPDTYYVVVDGYATETPGNIDEVTVTTTTVLFNEDSLSTNITSTITENENDFDLTVNWSKENWENDITGAILLLSSEDNDSSKQIALNVLRGENDVKNSHEMVTEMEPGVASTVKMQISPNFTSTDKMYTLQANIENHEAQSISNDGTMSDSILSWEIMRKAGDSAEVLDIVFDLIPRKSGTHTVVLSNSLNGDLVQEQVEFSVKEVSPVANISNTSGAIEGDSVTIDAAGSSDANGDALTFVWEQISGTPINFKSNGSSISFTAPEVSDEPKPNDTLSFKVTVSDSNGNSDSTSSSITVLNKRTSSGSLFWSTLLLPLIAIRRRFVKH